MTAVRVVGSASAFRRDHGGAERSLWSTFLAKSWALMWFLQAAQDLSADTHARFLRSKIAHLEQKLRIEVAVFWSQLVATLWNRAHTAPLAVADFKHTLDEFAGLRITILANGPAVLVFYL